MLRGISILSFFLTFCVHAQKNGVKFTHLNTNHGLSQSFIISIAQDQKGFMWFGTENGLNKYDGYTFTVYNHNPEDPTTISNNRIGCMLVDSRGRFWIGTTAGLDQFDFHRNIFIHFNTKDEVFDIAEDKKGDIWICNDKGLNRVDSTHKALITYQDHAKTNMWLRTICEDSKGNLWVGSAENSKGVFKFDPKQKTFQYHPFQKKPNNEKGFRVIEFSIFEDHTRVLWVALNNGLYRYDGITDDFIKYEHRADNPNSVASDNVHCLAEDADGNIWMGHRNGISVLDKTRQKFTRYQYDLNNPTGLTENFITTFYKDKSNNLWIGSRNTGLNILFRTGNNFKLYTHELNDEKSLNNNVVKAILKDKKGRLWLGTDGGGLNFQQEDGSFFAYMHDPKDPKSLPNNLVLALYEDRQENIWVSTFNGALSKLNKGRGNFEHIFPSGDSTSLTSASVSVMYEDSKDNFWIGTWSDGLFLFDPKTKKFKNYKPENNDGESLSCTEVFEIYEDKRGNLWIGTGNGLNCFNYTTKKFTRYFYDEMRRNTNTLSSNVFHSITEDKNGTLILATLDGLNLFDPQKSTSIVYRKKDGLPSDIIQAALLDAQGNIWVSTVNGIGRFNPQTKVHRNYGVADGLQGSEFIKHSYYQSDNGELYFGGNNGANCITPELIKPNLFIPPIVLTDFKIFNKSTGLGNNLQQHINYAKSIKLSYKESVFSFEFAALSFINPENNQYAYKLEGFDKNWNYIGNKNSITYTNLNAGEYTLRVIGSNNDGVWNADGVALSVIIVPPFWQTWWFISLSFFLFSAIIVIAIRVRENAIKNQKKELERQVRERTEEVLRQKDSVQLRTSELEKANKELEAFTYSVSHDLRAPLRAINGYGQILAEDFSDKLGEQGKKTINIIIDNGHKMGQLIDDLLNFSRLGKAEVRKHRVEMNRLVHEVLSELGDSGVMLPAHLKIGELKPALGDASLIRQVWMNLISNAIKYSSAKENPEVEIGMFMRDAKQIYFVKDNGVGFNMKYYAKLFGVFQRLHKYEEFAGTGVGLAIVERIISRHGGSVWADAKENEGAIFYFSLPQD
jgi:ligand-binding sensor domain-containing protein/signal transduction histidine kinase